MAAGSRTCWSDPRFATNAARVENRAVVIDTLTPVMRTMTTAGWMERLQSLNIAGGPINTLRECSQTRKSGRAASWSTCRTRRRAQGVDVIANPVRLSETPADYRLPPPLLGQHTDEVLAGRLGIDDTGRAALRARGVI